MAVSFETFRQQRRSVFYPKADLPLSGEAFRGVLQSAPILSNQEIAHLCRHSLGQQVRQVTPLAELGTCHQLWRVRLAGGLRVIFRANAIPQSCHDYPLLLDSAIGEHLRANGIPALTVLDVDLSRKNCCTDYSILLEAQGVPLKQWDRDEGKLQSLLWYLGRFLAKVHQIRVDGYGLLDARTPLHGCHSSWNDYIQVNLESHIQRCEKLTVISPAEADRIREVFTTLISSIETVPSALLHGDPGSHNVFVNEDITCMIDWEDSLAGDPIYEIAFWATFHPERRHARFLEGYRSIAEIPDDFEIRFWLYFLRVSLAKTVVRDRLGLRDVPGREPASQRVLKGLERIERMTGVTAVQAGAVSPTRKRGTNPLVLRTN